MRKHKEDEGRGGRRLDGLMRGAGAARRRPDGMSLGLSVGGSEAGEVGYGRSGDGQKFLNRAGEWWKKSVLYQIYPLSFMDADGDGFGDLKGIIERLDYLNDGTANSLGVGAIWLSPIYVSPMADWGYDVVNHREIDPRFGTMRDFERLIDESHRRGIKVLMDYVPNHVSVEHPWFKEARSSRKNKKRDWFIWAGRTKGVDGGWDGGRDGIEDDGGSLGGLDGSGGLDGMRRGGPPNNWLSVFGGSAWEWDEKTGQYFLHMYLPEQVDLNWRNPEVRKEMLDVLRFWLGKGVDGFRTDAVLSLLKDDELRDDVPNPAWKAGVSDPADRFLRVHSSLQYQLSDVVGSFCDVLAEKEDTYSE